VVNLVTVKDRELMKVGKWNVARGGEFNVTPELIQSALAAHKAGVLRKPTIRLGHNDPRFSGDPAVGWVDNVHASEDGSTLYGDLVGVPEWLAKNMPSAYPSLSIEGMYDYKAPDGTTHDFILTGLALLGATVPGIGALKSVQDVEALYADSDVAAAVGEIGGTPVQLVEAADAPKPYGDVRYADPKNGKYPIDSPEHCRAAWSYINMPKNQKGYSAEELAQIKDRIKAACKKFGIKIEAAAAAGDERVVMASFKEQLAEKLGLDPDADEDKILEAFVKATEQNPEDDEPKADAEPSPEPVAAASGADTMTVDRGEWDRMVQAAQAGVRAEQRQVQEDDLRIVEAAIALGKFPPARKQHWLDYLKKDREGGRQIIASLATGLVPVGEIGHSQPGPEEDAQAAEMHRVEERIFASLGFPTKKAGSN
jgi:hypothetical protein